MSAAAPTPELPSGLRFARPGDEERLFEFCEAAHADNGQGGMDAQKVRAVIAAACRGETYVVALVDGPERIEAAVGLQPMAPWYGDDTAWFWTDLFVFVHPLHRQSGHWRKLFRFVRWWAAKVGYPVILYIWPQNGDLMRKTALFARFGRIVGAGIEIRPSEYTPRRHFGSSVT